MGGTQSSGKYSDRTKAEEVAVDLGGNCRGKYIIVTGGNSGIGREAARVFALQGAKVVICSRSVKNGEDACAWIKSGAPYAEVTTMQLDLNSFKSIQKFADAYKALNIPLNLLINNAGIMACPYATTEEGFESQFGVNHLGHFYLTQLLLPVLISSGTRDSPSRVVNLSSCAHWLFCTHPDGIDFEHCGGPDNYSAWVIYGESKLANILFTVELNKRMKAAGHPVISVALHPGSIMGTNLLQHSNASSMCDFMSRLYAVRGGVYYMMTLHQKSIPEGAATTVYCALSPDIAAGSYYEDCHLSSHIHPKALDEPSAKRLWDISEKMVASKK